ncbi:MAG TPA: LytTR family DNA-binding domain-containing protein, partial [Longimicrobiales bacterium]|nr:LytTR family DNA-binding domain-containing protein [Longimicrobiales bacterium]
MRTAPVAAIVEDEPLARDRLRELLEADGRVEVAGEAADGEAAIRLVDALRPDLLFLDIDIPGPSGLEVLEAVRCDPAVIFTTAFDHYAIPAFDLAAIDYLLKPFSPRRLKTAVDRALAAAGTERSRESTVAARTRAREVMDASRPLQRLFVPHRDGARPVPVAEVQRFEGRDDYVAVHDGESAALIRARLKDLEKRLDPADFIRVHRWSLRHVIPAGRDRTTWSTSGSRTNCMSSRVKPMSS